MDVALESVWVYSGESLSNAFEVSFRSSFGISICIKAIVYPLGRLITRNMKENTVQSSSGKPITDNEVLWSENDLCLDYFLRSKSKMTYSLQHRRLYLSEEAFQEMDTGNMTATGRTTPRMRVSLTMTCLKPCRKTRLRTPNE